ncbi:MAG TPA: tandem-95 repeat protein [Verrucomicrobiae bacterium]
MFGSCWKVSAQAYVLRYVTTDSGGITFVGNTLGLAKLTQVNQPGALDAIGAFITLNTNSQVGTYAKGTTLNWSNNSSASVLQLPTNSTVLYAELIWAGTSQISTNTTATGDVIPYLNTPVHFILPNGSSNNITPDTLTASMVTNGTVTAPTSSFYTRSANVTSLVQAGGSGTYSAGGIPACVLATEDNNNACGWTLAVVYEDTLLHQRNLSLFVGNSFASTTATTPAPIGVVGFCSPPTGTINGYLFVSAIEGDPNKTGDEILFGPSTNNMAVLSGPNNISNNFFAGQINYANPDSSSNGLLNTTGTFGLSNSVPPNVGFSARQGWDITCVNVSSGLTNGIESAYAQNITSGDGYSVDALALEIDVGSPVLTTTQSVNKASTFVGDTLTYTVVVTNSGTADGVNLVFSDPLPFGTSFVANTFATNGVTITGANPVNGVPIPDIPQGSSMTFTYSVTVDQIPPSAMFVTHATIGYQYSGPCAESPIINSTLVNLNVQTLVPLLDVNKVSSLSNVIPGATFTYTINIPNNGTTNTIDATLQDPLPVGVTYVTNTTTLNGLPVPDVNGTNMPYAAQAEVNGPGDAAGVINAGQTAVVTFQVKIVASPPLRINNSATIFANGIQPTTAANAQNNISPVYCDLSANISASPNPVEAGGPVTFTITVTNFGTNSLNDVTNFVDLYLPLPSSIESPIYTPGTGAYNPLTGVWSGITLPSNGVVTMTVTGTLNPATTATNLIGSVTVSPPPGVTDLNSTNNSSSSTNAIQRVADLMATITDGLTNVYEGSSITNIITIVNLGPSTVTSLTLSNFISSTMGNVTVFAADGIFNQAAGTWTALSIGVGGSVQITEVGTVLTVSGPFTNSVIVYPPSGVTDPNFANNSASNVNFALPLPDTSVTKTGPAAVDADTNFIYTITITNAGPGTASNVVASDTLPVAESFVNASGGGVDSAGTVNWTIGTVAANGSSNVTVTVTAPVTGVSLTNIASIVASTPTANPANDTSAPVVTTVTPVADVGIGKTGPAGVVATSNLTYTVSVTNFGPSVASGVVATDTLPSQVTYSSSSGGGVHVGRTVGWVLGSLNIGQITNVTVTVTAPAAAGSITNTAATTATTLDTNLVNNAAPNVITTVSTLANSADISVKKTGAPSVFATSNLTYTITVTNIGPAAAANVTASDTFPTNVNFFSASGGGTLTSGTVNWTIGALALHGTTNLTLIVTAPGNGSITNIATASSTTADPVSTNNTSAPVVTTVTPAADLAIGKSAAATIFATSNLTYTISLTNLGPSDASGVIVTDTLPQGSIFVSAGASGTTNAGVASWSLGTFPVGSITNFTLVVTAPISGALTNTASVTTTTADPVPGDNVSPKVITTVTPLADLGIGKSGAPLINATSNLTYTISVTNFGPSAAGTITVTDALPAGVIFVSATGSGTTNSGVATWNLASMAPGAITNFSLVVTAPISGSLTNIAGVTSPTTDTVPGNNVSPQVVTTVTPSADLAVVASAPPTIFATSNLTYSITVTNSGPSTASGVIVTDTLPAGVIFVSAGAGGTTNAGVVSWSLGTLMPGATTNFTFIVTVPASGSLTDTASVISSTSDPVPGNNVSSLVVTAITASADLAIGKTGAPTVVATSNLSYTISVTNLGPSTASGVVVTDALPVGASFGSAPGGANIAGMVTWTLASMTPGAITNLTLTVTAPANGSLTNIAGVTSPTGDPVPGNNISPPVVTTVTPSADLAIGKSGAGIVTATSNLSYTISVTNLGPSTASTITVTDALPAGVIFVSATSSGTTNNGVATWTLATLASNAVTNFTLVVTAPISGILTNTASVISPTVDPVTTNNVSPPVTTTVTPSADLAVGETAPPTVFATSNLTYTVTVTNFGPSTASGVIVTDTLPAGVIFVSAGAGGTTNAGVVSWSLGVLTPGATTNFTFIVTVPASGSLTNTSTVTSPTSDPVLPNNVSSQVVTTITSLADLAIGKSGSGIVTATSNLSYTISVTNFGPSTANSVVVTDTLPAGVTFVSATGSGTTNNGAATWNLASLAANATTNFTLVVTAPVSGTLTNIASVTSPTVDPVTTNNVSPPVTTTVTPLADLAIGKSGAASVFAASNLSYTISVTNFGPSAASTITVTDALPAGVTFVSATGSGTTNNGVATWTLATLAVNTSTNFALVITAPASGILTNIASVTSPTSDPVPTNNVSPPVVTTVTPLADLAAIKTGPANLAVGSAFAYTIVITNLGPSTASGVVATDALPVGLSFVSASGNGVNNAGLVTWNLGTLAAGVATNLLVNVTAPVDGIFTNIAEAGSSVIDPNPTNNNGTATNSQVMTAVSPVADLGISKLGPANVFAATNFAYTIVVTNGGPSTASNVVASDVLPTNVIFSSASAGGVTNAGTVNWSLGNLPINSVTNLTVTVTAPATGTISNTASVTASTADTNQVNNISPPVMTTVTPLADLAIGKSGAGVVVATSNLVYTISVTNFGPSTASGVLVTDTLPAGVIFVSATGSGTTNNGVASWNLTSLAANATTNFTLTVAAPVSGTLTNTASVTSPTVDPVATNNVSPPVTTTVTPLADLAIGKSALASVIATSNLSYTISVTNFGPSTASTITVTDTLPAGVTFVSATGSGTTNNGVATWNLASLAANATTNFTLIVTAPVSGTLTNTASVTSPTVDPVTTNNVSPPVTTTVTPLADLAIGKSGAGAVVATSNLSYTISVTNFGPSVASTITVTDTLPAGVIFVSATGSGTTNNGVATWNLASLAANTTTNFTLIVTVPASGTLTNIASVTSPTVDPVPTNNVSPPVTTTVTPLADLAIGKSGAASVFAASNLSYTISVTNLGPSAASSITVTDALPVGVTFVSATGGGTTNNGVATWTLATLAANTSTNFTLIITAPASGILTNIASVTSPTSDPVSTNNVSPPVITTVTPVADLAIGKSAAASVFAASNLTYTVTVTNFGPSTASSIVVTDALPAGVTFVSATGGGTTNNGVATWNLASLAANATTNFTLIITAPASGTLTNIASVTSPIPDPNLTNDVTPPVVTTVTPLADLGIAKSGPAGVLFNTDYSYSIVVTNSGPSTGMSISVTDSLPAGLVFVSATPSAVTNGSLVVWTNIGDLPPGAATNLALSVISTLRGTVTNLASVGSPTLDPTPSNSVSPPAITTITNDPPIANPDTNNITENTANTLTPLNNDVIQTPGGILTIISISPTNGTAIIIGGTNVVFTPTTNFLGTATIGYTITDNVGGTNSGLITVIVTNIPPLANPDTYLMPENTSITTLPLANDVVQTPGGTLRIISVSPTNGTAAIFGGTNVLFTPTTNFLGTATIGYTITDGIGGTNSSLITVTVTNRPPLANPDAYNVTENTANTLTPLNNDVVETSDGSLSIISVAPTNGTATIIGGTNVLFVPTTNFLGTATIGYTIIDNVGGTNSSLITITVTNRPPLANPDNYFAPENTDSTLAPLNNDITETPGGILSIISVAPTNGTASIIGGTNVLFTPTTNFLGTATIGYTIIDNIGGTNSSLISITVTNIAPLANPLTNSITENTTNTFSPLTNDVVVTPGGTLTIVSVSPTNGTATIVGGTNVVFAPTTNFLGTTTIGYTITDGIGGTNSSLITVIVTNIPPIANPDNYNVAENTGSTLAPLNNDIVETPGGSLSIISVAPANGTASIIGGTNVLFTPLTNFLGTATIGYTITDGIGGTNSSLITITVTNIAPLANLLTNSITENTTNTFSPLTNDVVVTPGGILTVVSVNPTNGTATIIGGTNVLFVPTTDFLGTATIGYTITDGIGGTNSSLITVIVTNIPPIANPDTYNVLENTGSTLSPLNNDVVETPGGTLSIISVSPTNGTTTIIGGTNVLFTPTTNFLGTATIGYTITDNIGGTNSSLITITVTNRPPLANPETNSVTENTSNTFSPLTNDVVVTPGGTLTIVSVSPTNGIATIIGGTNVLFTPTTNFLGTATISYTITDGIGGTNSSLITVIVTNIPPLANPDAYGVTENTSNTLLPLNNDIVETPGGNLSIIFVTPTNGTASIIGGTNVLFTPTTNFLGTATIGYTITDGIGGTNRSLITIAVTNIPPLANPDFYLAPENTSITTSPLTNDVVQTPGGTLRIVSLAPTNGIVSIVSGTNVLFTPTTNFLGTATIGYTITDGIGGTNSSLITVTVTNRPPLANPDTYNVTENTTNTLTPLSNDVVQTPGGTLIIISVSPTNGTATILGGTNVSFVPSNDFLGTATIGYTIIDNVGGTNSSLVTITVTNRAPLANPDAYSMGENTTNTLTPLFNDVLETPGGTLTIISVSPTNGTATIVGGTNVTFVPTLSFIGTATIGYTITDGIGGTNSSLITVMVTNRPPTANPQNLMTPANTPLPITLTGNDPQSLPLTYLIVTSPTNGTLSNLNTNTGAVTYTPNTNYFGTDTFTFRVNDGQTNSTTATVTLTVSAAADVAVLKFGPASGAAGSNLVYTIVVTNNGPSTATNVLVSDQLPLAFTFVSAVPTGSTSNNLVTWPSLNLTNKGSRTFTVTAVSTSNGTYTNVAFSTATTMDPNPTNNNGTATNSQVTTSVSPAADVAVFNSGPAAAAPGGTIAYTITVTNLGPSTASNVVVQDVLPAGATFVSATSGITPIGGTLTWPAIDMPIGSVAVFTVTVTAPANGVLVDVASSTASTFDANPANNNGTAAASRVTTVISPVADIQVYLFGPTNVTVGDGFSYTVEVTNAGPSTASNILARDILPTNVVFSSASTAGIFSNGIVTWPTFGSLTNGQATNLTVQVVPSVFDSSNVFSYPLGNTAYSFVETNTTFIFGFLTNIASAFATTFDPNLTNNNGTLPTAQVETVIVPGVFDIFVATNTYPTNVPSTNTVTPIGPDLFAVGTGAFNPQTGFFEESVTITNIGTIAVHSLRLYVAGLRSGVSIYNATGTNNGVPYVEYDPQYSTPLLPAPSPDDTVTFVLEFRVLNRQPFTDTLTVVATPAPTVTPPPGTPINSTITEVPDNRVPGDVRFLVQFNSIPGRTYTVEYGPDVNSITNVAVPSIVAAANVTQWYDDGPPETVSKPSTVLSRFYLVILNP